MAKQELFDVTIVHEGVAIDMMDAMFLAETFVMLKDGMSSFDSIDVIDDHTIQVNGDHRIMPGEFYAQVTCTTKSGIKKLFNSIAGEA
jgi:hypothetical protein